MSNCVPEKLKGAGLPIEQVNPTYLGMVFLTSLIAVHTTGHASLKEFMPYVTSGEDTLLEISLMSDIIHKTPSEIADRWFGGPQNMAEFARKQCNGICLRPTEQDPAHS